MEFHEKLQELRKNRGLTQEDLAEDLYVSRTAISKWESGRGYPSIDSLKDISKYFSVSIDDLLSGEKLLSLAESENKSNIRNMCELLFGAVDVCTFLLILLPIYPNKVNEFVYSVNLLEYVETTPFNRLVHWGLFVSLIAAGVLKVLLAKHSAIKSQRVLADISMLLGTLAVLYFAVVRETYVILLAFILLLMKGALLIKKQ